MMKQKLKEVEVLQDNYDIPISSYDKRFTKTAQLMVPSIQINVTNKLVFEYFENAFLTDLEHPHNYERPIFMLFSVKNFSEINWKKVYNVLITSPNYLTEYDVGIKDGKYLVMIVFRVPDIYAKDYENFRSGRYSLFSKEYREKFPKYIDEKKEKKNIHWQIINKDPELRRAVETKFNLKRDFLKDADEIWDGVRKEREFYRFKK